MEPRKNAFMLLWLCHQLLSGFLANGHLPRVARLSTNDTCDNDMITEAVHRSPDICLTAEENLPKTSARKPSDKGCATSHRFKWDPLLPNEAHSKNN